MIIDAEVTMLQNISDDSYLGTHLICEFYDCDENTIDDLDLISKSMVIAAQKCGSTILEKSFHKFSPQGVSGVVIIQESHLSIHTWPEFKYAAVDIFTCSSNCKMENTVEYLKTMFKSRKISMLFVKRGKDLRGIKYGGTFN